VFSKLEIEAQLVVTANNVQFAIVAHEHYIIVNFPDFNSLDAMIKIGSSYANALKPTTTAPQEAEPEISKSGSGKAGIGGPLKKLHDLNGKIRDLGLVLDIRVNNKTYVELGSGKTAKITMAAILGKLGSFFGK
jgi:hypothetical protein